MPAMQKGYEWLLGEPAPKMLVEALKLYGVKEYPGGANNPVIMGWAKETGAKGYTGDSIAWCALGASVVAKRAGWDYQPGGNALWARNWALWGNKADVAMLGDFLVFPRGSGGHIGQYVGEDDTHYHVYGFNQNDTVNIVRKPKTPILAIRRAPWKIAQPPNVRRIFLSPKGAPVSGKES